MKKRTGVYEAVPESLATLLVEIRVRIFGLTKNQSKFARYLNDVRREPELSSNYRADVLGSIERRERILNFEHLDTYARLLGVPTSVLSFVSRYQRTSLDEAELVAQALLDVTKEARRAGRTRLTVRDLRELSLRIDLDVPKRPPIPENLAGPRSAIEEMQEQAQKGEHPDKDAQNLPLFENVGDNDPQ